MPSTGCCWACAADMLAASNHSITQPARPTDNLPVGTSLNVRIMFV
jgi:hypothetical protein